jgi:hypothetical protein
VSDFRRFPAFLLFFIPFSSSGGEVLWDHWYTVSERNAPHSYYNEKVEIAGDRIKIQLNTWIREGRKIRSENLGATAKNTELLQPLFYSFRTQVDGEEKVIDGTVDPKGRVFSVKVRAGVNQAKPLRAEMLPKLILASFFPAWINKNYKRITGVQPKEFQAILEDRVEGEIPVIRGTAYEMRADEFATRSKTRKLRVEFDKSVAIWWVEPKGDALRIEVPALERVVNRTTREAAETFLSP